MYGFSDYYNNYAYIGHNYNCLFNWGVMLISCTKCGFVKLIERIACSLSLLLIQLRTSLK